MKIPLISQLTPILLSHLHPHLHPPPTSPTTPTPAPVTLTFTPRHAHAHDLDRGPARLYFHDAAGPSAFLFSPASDADDDADHSAHADDSVEPHLLDLPLEIRTRTVTIRRPRVRPPHMLSWAESARAAAAKMSKKKIGGGGGNVTTTTTTTWVAPDFESEFSSADNTANGWHDVEVEAPDVTDRQTLLTLAKMTSNAYTTPASSDWYPLDGWNSTLPFGWSPDTDGLRGHVFADDTNSTVIIAIKGTSAGVLGSGGPTAKNDKYNDNLMFSCCCARVDFSWTPVCDCYAGGYRCEQTCLEDALIEESVYATVGTNLYNNVTYMYPNANIWLAGHSLGGSLSALIALSFGAPAVGFEAPGDRLPARRLHLPQPPGMPAEKTGIVHVYHTADPIPNGVCTGAYSGCYAAGFALESKCHVGQTILYDTVTVKGWAVDIRTHRIAEVINKVLADPWPVSSVTTEEITVAGTESTAAGGIPIDDTLKVWWGWGGRGPGKGDGKGDGEGEGDDKDDGGWERHGGVPKAVSEADCVDCYKWEFGDNWDKK